VPGQVRGKDPKVVRLSMMRYQVRTPKQSLANHEQLIGRLGGSNDENTPNSWWALNRGPSCSFETSRACDTHDKLRLTNTQIQFIDSVAYAIVSLTRSVIVEQVESIVVAVMEKSLEFVIRCLECSVVGFVDFCKSELEVECSCKHYEAYGLLCRHICYIGYIGSENKRNLDEELAATKKKNTVKRVADEEYTERRIASKDC
ncbi:FAR1 DNA binding domain, zinc finger, SWIM-type, MULE transposase domain containing protein, partial [Tanacetum coccineum]